MANWTSVVSRAVRSLALTDAELQSDRDLVARFASGDQVAFAALVSRHTPMVFGVCRRLLTRAQDAEDATQAVFVLLARKAKNTSWQPSLANWLYTAARNVAWNARLVARRRARHERRSTRAEAASPLDDITGRELLLVLDEELDRLPPRYREPLVLCHLQGLSREEAAARLGVPEATLKSQLERGRKKLADALTARGCTLTALLLLVTAGTSGASSRLVDSILASVSGPPPEAVSALIEGVTMKSLFTTTNLLALLGVSAVLLGLGLAGVQLTSARPHPDEPKRAEKKPDEPKVEAKENSPLSRIGSTHFRADQRIGDARYSGDGKRIVGFAGAVLHVWEAGDGKLLRKINTGLELIPDPETSNQKMLLLAVQPKANRVACGAKKDGRLHLQVWDFDTGELLAEKPAKGSVLLRLAWTPDGKRLLERTNTSFGPVREWKLNVRDEKLEVVHSHDLPKDYGERAPSLLPLPDSKTTLLWQDQQRPSVLDIETGVTLREIDFKPSLPSDLALSRDGKTLLATGINEMWLFDFATGKKLRELPVLRRSWEKPRPAFSPDGKTVYVWDHHPMAYDVDTGKLKWKAASPVYYGGGMAPRDLSPDGSTFLLTVGKALVALDTRTGIERPTSQANCGEADLVWSPDGKLLFSRDPAYGKERTWAAWEAATGKPLYRVVPGAEYGDNWKLAPDLFFLNGGKEFLVCLVKNASHEMSAYKDLLVFDTATGKLKRKHGDELGEPFRWLYPVAAADDGSTVTMQAYAISSDGPVGGGGFDWRKQPAYPMILWDPIKKVKLREWTVYGHRPYTPRGFVPYGIVAPRRFGPYTIFSAVTQPVISPEGGNELEPAKVRCYSLADGRPVHELAIGFNGVNVDRIQGTFLLSVGFNREWVKGDASLRCESRPPFAHEIWELPTGERARLFDLPKPGNVVLGPGAKYLIRVIDERSFEVYEPFALKRPIATVETPGLASYFEFSPDGTRVAASLADTTIAVWDTTPWVKKIDDELREQIPQDLNPLWDDLAKEPEVAMRASRLLSLTGDRALALFAAKIAAKAAPDGADVKRLIRELDSPQFATRQKAERELRGVANQIEVPLHEALKANPSAEARQRIEELLRGIAAGKLTGEERREIRAVGLLKAAGGERAMALLAKWAKGDPSATLTRAARE